MIERMAGPETELVFKRAFNWGVVVLSDAGAPMPPYDKSEAPVLGRSPSALVLAVRHASDQDEPFELDADGNIEPFEVQVEASLGAAKDPTSVEHVLSISTGRILIGDADGEEEMPVHPGLYRVAVYLDDQEFASLVRLWFDRLDE